MIDITDEGFRRELAAHHDANSPDASGIEIDGARPAGRTRAGAIVVMMALFVAVCIGLVAWGSEPNEFLADILPPEVMPAAETAQAGKVSLTVVEERRIDPVTAFFVDMRDGAADVFKTLANDIESLAKSVGEMQRGLGDGMLNLAWWLRDVSGFIRKLGT